MILLVLGITVFAFLVYISGVIATDEKEDRYGR